MSGAFAAAVDAWTRESKDRMSRVHKESVQRTIAEMQKPTGDGGNLPVDTGFLRASLKVSIGEDLPQMVEAPAGGKTKYDEKAQVELVITGADLSDTLTAAYTANYARRIEYGFDGADSLGRTYKQSGVRFVALAAQQWPQIVSRVVIEAKARAGA